MIFYSSSPDVILGVSGPLYERNRVVIICNIHVNASVVREVRVVAFWRRGTTQITNNNQQAF